MATASGFSRAQLWRARCTQRASILSVAAASTQQLVQTLAMKRNAEGCGRHVAGVTGIRVGFKDSELDSHRLSSMVHLMLNFADSWSSA